MNLSRRKQLQYLAKGLLIRVCLGFYIKDECHQKHTRRCIPERVLRLTALGGCCLEQIRDKPLYIVVTLGIEKRIVAHGLLHVDEIKHPHFISLCFQQLSGVTQDLSLWIKHHKAGIALHDIRLGIKSRFARTRTADHKGIEISAMLVRVVPDLHILRQDFVHLPWGLAVLLGDLLCFPPLGGAVFHAAAVIGLRIVVDEKRKPVNCRKD